MIKFNIILIIFKLVSIFFSLRFFKFSKIFDHDYKFCINIIGYYDQSKGLYQSFNNLFASLNLRNNLIYLFDINSRIFFVKNVNNRNLKSINFFVVNPDQLYKVTYKFSPSFWFNNYNIGNWFWELPVSPKPWLYSQNFVDEIWVHSDYVKESFKRFRNVVKVPFCVDIESFSFSSTNYSVSNSFIFLNIFDMKSSFDRKNPLGLIQAFRAAFHPKVRVRLLIKVNNLSSNPACAALLFQAASLDKRIEIIDLLLDRVSLLKLISSSDCYISLHRSEGLGLLLAEAMALGKPVIATDYSGNLEFMHGDNSFLVSKELVPVKNGQYPYYLNQYWAEPSIESAAEQMVRVYQGGSDIANIVENGRLYISKNHSITAVSDFINMRISTIIKDF